MGNYVVSRFIEEMKKKIKIKNSKFDNGINFKENCADVRNSGIKSVIEKKVVN